MAEIKKWIKQIFTTLALLVVLFAHNRFYFHLGDRVLHYSLPENLDILLFDNFLYLSLGAGGLIGAAFFFLLKSCGAKRVWLTITVASLFLILLNSLTINNLFRWELTAFGSLAIALIILLNVFIRPAKMDNVN